MKTPLIDIRPDHWAIVRDILQKHVPQYEVWAFGSRAKWTAKEYSDLDLAVITDKPLSLSVSAALADDFSESDLPWKVDVVDWATTSESFCKIIERDKVVVQEAKVGRVMAGEWHMHALGDLTVNHDNKRKPVKEADRKPGPYPYYGASGIVDYVNDYVIDGDYLLVAEDGENLRTRQTPIAFMAKGKSWVNNHAHIVTGNEKADTLFLMYALQAADISGYLTGAVMPKLTQGNLNKIQVLCPSLDEQRAIAHILGTLDDKIELNRRMSETLEAIARAIFKSWFVDFDPVRAKASGEAPESICRRLGLNPDLLALFPDRIVDSELGEIPEGWEVRGLDTIALLSTASTSPGKRPHEVFEHYSIPAFDSRTMPAYELGSTIKSNKYVVSPNAVLVSKLNPETPRVWLPAVKTERAVCSTEFMQFVPLLDYGRTYLYLMMCSEPMQVEILKRVTGSTGSRQRAQPSQIATLPIVVPTEKVVRAFESLVTPVLVDTVGNLDQSQTLFSLRDTLLPKLLSGELRVQDDKTSDAMKEIAYG